MDCQSCASANREGAKFCAQCSAALPAACDSCGSALSPSARFCDQCGAPVAGRAVAREDTVTRRVVTVLLADLVGSTSFGERVDAESAREALAEYHTMAREVIESAGGTVAKFIGDGVMALFGVPEIAEDDALRAVSAGLAFQRGFAPIRGRVARRHGVELGLRVGVNSGELVLADGDTDVVGDAVNTAARLEAACTPGHVLVGEETWRLTRSHVRYEVLGEVTVKGKDVPVATFQVADDEVRDDDQATPFVGRVAELARLGAVFDDSVEHRTARLAMVIGAPGVGKTRIAREFCDSVADRASVAELRCERAGTATFAPIADLLRMITTLDDESDADHVRDVLRALVADLDDADRIADLLASFVGAAPARSTEEAFLAVRRLLEAAGRRRPLVVVVDDIQWAEPLFLDLLEHLADWVHEAPALLIGLARPELRELRPSLAEESRTSAATIGLEGLDAAATAELAARLIGAESLPSELIERLPDSTEGNPLFVRELMRMLVDDGVIEETASGWQLTIDAEAVEVPPTIQSLLAARLDRMPRDERRLVELASVVGPEFALGAVAAISDSEPAELRLALDRLQRRELVESTGMYWGDEPIFRFHHVLIRDAAYRRLLKRARADLHLRVGEWTEHTAASLVGEHEVAIAHHYEQAHEYRRQLDDVDEAMAAVGRRAAELLGAAAARSLERDDLPAASSLAERALARLDQGDTLVPAMLVVAAEALLALGDVGRGRPVVERLTAVVGDDARLAPWAESFVAQLTMLTEPDRLHQAEEQADRAAAALAELGDEAGVAKARLVRAGALARLGQVGQCEAELDLALTAARSAGDRRRVAAVLGAAPLAALWGPSPIPRAGGRCLDVIRLLRITTGSPAVEATSVRCQAVLEALRGRFDTARSMLADSRATVEELGLRHALGETDLFTGIVELLADDAAAAEGALQAAYDGLRRLGIGADAGQAAAYLARAVLQLGRVEEAEALAAESAELAGENLRTAVAARAAQAEILAAQGRFDEAVAVANDAVARAEGTDIIVDHAAAGSVLARVAQLAGDAATAERAARVASDLYQQKAATVAIDLAPAEPVAEAAEAATRAPGGPIGSDEDGPWSEADRLTRRFVESFTAGAREEWLPMLSPDQVTIDRRPVVGVDTTGADAVADAYPRDQESGALSSEVETIAVRGESFALVRWRATSAHGREWDLLHLTRWTTDGLNDLNVIFPADHLDEALEELDRLHREHGGGRHEPWNDADRRSRELLDRVPAGDEEGLVRLLDPGVRWEDRRPMVRSSYAGPDQFVAALTAGLFPDGVPVTVAVETIASRGDRLVMQSCSFRAVDDEGGPELRVLLVARWQADGLLDFAASFDDDGLIAAFGELERLYDEELGDSLDGLRHRALGQPSLLLPAGDIDAFVALHDPAFVMHDHRQIGWGDLDLDGWRERLESIVELPGTMQLLTERELRLDHSTSACWTQRIVLTTPDGVTQTSRSAMVMIVDPYTGLITSIEQFDEDDLDGAVARFDELMAERGPVPHNEASVRASFVNSWLVVSFDTRFVLHRDGHALVGQVTDADGRIVDRAEFGLDGETAARQHLATSWLRSLSRRRGKVAEIAQVLGQAWVRPSGHSFDDLLAPGFQLVDGRTLGMGNLDRAAFEEALRGREADGATGPPVPSRVQFVSDDVMVFRANNLGHTPESGLEWEEIACNVMVVDADRIARLEMFDEDHWDDAMARAREVAAGQAPERRLDNMATRWADRAASAGGHVDVGAFSHDFVREDRRSGVAADPADRVGLIESMRVQNEMGATYAFDPIAVRGDRIALGNLDVSYDDNDIRFLSVIETADDELAHRMVHFDPDDLAAAQDELDRLYLATLTEEQAATLRPGLQFRSAMSARGTAVMSVVLADDFVAIDHRDLAFPDLDRDEFLAANRQRDELFGEALVFTTDIHRIEGDVIVASNRMAGLTPDSGVEWLHEFVNIFMIRGGRLHGLENFGPDDLAAALDRADELATGRS